MAAVTLACLLALVLVTATVSGVFGMAGGLMLMGGLTLVMPVQAAMVTHGAVQLVSNGWRAVIHRRHIGWPIIAFYAAGSLMAAFTLAAVSYAPSRAWTFLFLGLIPALAWLPKGVIEADAAKPSHAVICGLGVTGLNLIAGVAGPLLDVFFVRTTLTRHQIVSTKAATQVLSHLSKIIFYGAPLIAGAGEGFPPLWFFALAVPLSMLGAMIGGRILDRMSDVNFLKYSKYIITALGVFYLAQAAKEFMQ
ncbi:MAG: sulfite exporter TauE/SafE family protein [Caulobacterales bacterium]